MSEATIGAVAWDGTEYEIDWPFEIDDETLRADFAVIYLDGQQLAEFVNPTWGPFENEEHVLELAFSFISEGELDDE